MDQKNIKMDHGQIFFKKSQVLRRKHGQVLLLSWNKECLSKYDIKYRKNQRKNVLHMTI